MGKATSTLRPAFACADCGHSSPRWFGKCPECGSWTSAEQHGGTPAPDALVTTLAGARGPDERVPTGCDEMDRVLGGGLVAGAAVLLAGEPGVGKSTLALQLMNQLVGSSTRCLLVTGEESLQQVAMRGARLGIDGEASRVATTTALPAILKACEAERPQLLIVDSIQTLQDPELEQAPGSMLQVRGCTARLVRLAKDTGCAVLLIGHVTKDGAVAGPKALEHMVDVVLTLDGERSGTLRLLRSSKNRFGSCDETGVYSMNGSGLEAVADPSAMLLDDRRPGAAGSMVFPSLEGSRPVLVEIQALVAKHSGPQPRRAAIGLDSRRLALVAAVLDQCAGVQLGDKDVFTAAAGGFAVREPAADLALGLALYSASKRLLLPPRAVAVGEIGLGGEVRRVPGLERRLAEAARLGFDTAIAPRGVGKSPAGMEVVPVSDLIDAFGVVGRK